MNALEKLVAEGFTLRSLPAYPRHLQVEKHDCAALLEMTPEGKLKQFSAAGYLVDGQIALLVERGGRNETNVSFRVFAYKGKEVPAEGMAMENFRRFERELRAVLENQ
jgi:hypothetical protein